MRASSDASLAASSWYDVRAFGALGDGDHDDTAAIQAAVNACLRKSGTVHFPAGIYHISSPIKSAGSTYYMGDGQQSSIVVLTSRTADGFDHAGQAPLTMSRMTVKSRSSQTAGALVKLRGAATSPCISPRFFDCAFSFGFHQIDAADTELVTVEQCVFIGCQMYEIILDSRLNADAGDSVITNNTFGGSPASGSAAILHTGQSALRLTNNKFFTYDYAHRILLRPRIEIGALIVANNSFERQRIAHLSFERQDSTSTLSSITVTGNVFMAGYSGSEDGTRSIVTVGPKTFVVSATFAGNIWHLNRAGVAFTLESGSGWEVVGNQFLGNAGTSQVARISAGCTHVNFGPNQVIGVQLPAVYEAGASSTDTSISYRVAFGTAIANALLGLGGLLQMLFPNNRFLGGVGTDGKTIRSLIGVNGSDEVAVGAGQAVRLGHAVAIGSGNRFITGYGSATAPWNPGAIANGTAKSTAITVAGAKAGDVAFASFSLPIPAGAMIGAAVIAPNTVRVTIVNASGTSIALANGVVRADILQNA